MAKLNLFGTANDSIVDGPGLRYVVFTQGCPHKCKGCHNPESQEFRENRLVEIDQIIDDIKSNPLGQGVTLSGGEPFSQAGPCAELAEKLKHEGYNIWCYTGNYYEKHAKEAKKSPDIAKLLDNIDVLVDGPFVEDLKSYSADWRGSTNQRIIDMKKTRETGKLALYEIKASEQGTDIDFPKPESW